MIIAPNSNAKLLTGVPIDSSYNHTVWFDNTAEQKAFFDGHVKSDVVTSSGQTFTFSLTGLTNQRVERNYISVNIPYALLLDINYVMFQNTMYDATKWFYAFVTNIEYVNTVTTNVYYEIDLIQTFLFDFTLQNVRVDRELVVDEGRRDASNNMPTTGWAKYTVKDSMPFKPNIDTLTEVKTVMGDTFPGEPTRNKDDFFIVFMYQTTKATVNPNYTTDGSLISLNTNNGQTISSSVFIDTRTITATEYFVYDSSSAYSSTGIISSWLEAHITQIITYITGGVIEGIITDIQIVPKVLFNNIHTLTWNYGNVSTRQYDFQIPDYFRRKNSTTLSNYYVPKNFILYTSPYCYLNVTDFAQNSFDFLPDYITKISTESSFTLYRFFVTGFLGQMPCIIFYPYNYQTVLANDEGNLNYSFVLDNGYQMPWSENYYNRWYSQNAQRLDSLKQVNAQLYQAETTSNFVRGFGNFAGSITNTVAAGGAGMGNILTSLTDTATSQIQLNASNFQREQSILQEISVAQNTPPIVKGSPSMANALMPQSWYGFTMTWKTLSAEEAKILDEYYSLYGYKLNVVKTPVLYDTTELDCRKCWNYFKTSQCRLTRTENGANLNAADEEAIQAIFDRGITFWRNRDDVVIGDYSQDNPVVAKIS